MSKKKEQPKIRRTWGINPVERVVPNKKTKEPLDVKLCPDCKGTGAGTDADETGASDCSTCEGTGVQ